MAELVQRPECARTGVYFLVGPDPDDSLRTRVYIGESDDVAQRLSCLHNRPARAGWQGLLGACLSDYQQGPKPDQGACQVFGEPTNPDRQCFGRCVVGNGTAHSYTNLPESDRADMAFFLEQIRIVLPVLGFDFLRELIKPSKLVMAPVEQPVSQSPRFALQLPKSKERAQAQEVDGEFFCTEGSRARAQW